MLFLVLLLSLSMQLTVIASKDGLKMGLTVNSAILPVKLV